VDGSLGQSVNQLPLRLNGLDLLVSDEVHHSDGGGHSHQVACLGVEHEFVGPQEGLEDVLGRDHH